LVALKRAVWELKMKERLSQGATWDHSGRYAWGELYVPHQYAYSVVGIPYEYDWPHCSYSWGGTSYSYDSYHSAFSFGGAS
jgi:hypothetical protein